MNSTAKVGVFMFIILVLAGILIMKIQDIHLGPGHKGREIEAVFDNVAGLDDKSPVRVAGIRVGKVGRIKLEGTRARVFLTIDNQDVVLHQGARAKIVNMGLLGDKYVELSTGDPKAAELAPGTPLEGAVPGGFDQLTQAATDVVADIKEVSSSFRKAMGGIEGEKRVFEIVENIRQVTANLRDVLETNKGGVNKTVDNFEAFSGQLRTEVPKIAEQIRILSEKLNAVVDENRGGLKDSIENVKTLATKLQTSADNINAITTKINSGEGTIGKLVNSDEAHKKLTDALDSVSSGVGALTKALGKIGNTRFDMGFDSAYYSDVEKSRSAFDIDITPKDSKRYYKVEVVALPYGKRATKTETVTTTYPDGHTETTVTKKTKFDDALGITANIGYRPVEDLSLRAGLIDSRGGVGVDYEMLGRKLKLSLEAFDFDRKVENDSEAKNKMHLRVTGRWNLTDNLFLKGGYDDPLYNQQRSIFFGGGVTWVDEDLKYMMGSVPLK